MFYYFVVVLLLFFFPQMHCHFIMAINNLKDGEKLLKNVQKSFHLSFSLVCLSHYVHGKFIRLLMKLKVPI